MKTIRGELQISENGTVWFNKESDGSCLLRLCRMEEKHIKQLFEGQLTDIMMNEKGNNRDSFYY